jgi:hypothetical protein
VLFLDRAVQIVRPVPQRNLRHLDARRNPERLDVRDVVEEQPGDRVHAQRVARRGRGQLLHPVVIGMERERNEGLEPAGLVL